MSVSSNPTTHNSVTLNLFQGPSGRTNGARGLGGKQASKPASSYSVREEKWALKQVQGDDIGNVAA